MSIRNWTASPLAMSMLSLVFLVRFASVSPQLVACRSQSRALCRSTTCKRKNNNVITKNAVLGLSSMVPICFYQIKQYTFILEIYLSTLVFLFK